MANRSLAGLCAKVIANFLVNFYSFALSLAHPDYDYVISAIIKL